MSRLYHHTEILSSNTFLLSICKYTKRRILSKDWHDKRTYILLSIQTNLYPIRRSLIRKPQNFLRYAKVHLHSILKDSSQQWLKMHLHLHMLIFDALIYVGDHIYVSGDLISVVYVCQKYSKVLLELQIIFLYYCI